MPTRTLTIELPTDLAEELEARVAAGLAQSPEDAIIDAIERTRDLGLEHWVRSEGTARAERLRAGLERTLTYDEVMAEIDARQQQRQR
jgi:Arc/MetJ-type ribon-helix-helix transcriptional regulator